MFELNMCMSTVKYLCSLLKSQSTLCHEDDGTCFFKSNEKLVVLTILRAPVQFHALTPGSMME